MRAIGETEQHSQRLAASPRLRSDLLTLRNMTNAPRLFRLGILPRQIAFLGLQVNEWRGMRDTLENGNCRVVAHKQIHDGCRRFCGRPVEILSTGS